MRRPSSLLSALCLAVALPAGVCAQSGQYTAPGELGRDPVDAREALRRAVDEARWRLGPLRLDPWLALRELAWVETRGQDGDLTASLGAGLRGYVPVGSKLVLAAQLLPEYIWWRDRADDRRLAGRYGAALFYHANRIGLEVKASSSDQNDFVSTEVDRQAEVDVTSLEASLDVPLTSRMALFARAGSHDVEITDDVPLGGDLSDLDRRSESVEGGLRLRLGSRLTLGLGAGSVETTFDDAARDRSNDGDYWLAELAWDRAKSGVSVSVRQNDLVGTPGSELETFDETTWRAQLRWSPSRRMGWALYGQRELAYSVAAAEPYYVDERVGVRLTLPVGTRLAASLFYEDGRHRFAGDLREDDTTSWGGSLSLPLGRRVRVDVNGRSSEIDAPGGRVRTTELGLRAGLSLGEEKQGWY